MTVTSDAELIARTRSGDMAAYDGLYRRYVADATKVARIVMRNDDEAQDLVSEAFMRVLRRLQDGGGPDDEFAPYLRTVVRRLAIDHYRSAQRTSSADPSSFDIMPGADDPIGKATDGQLVRRAFEALPARWQEVLWRTEVEGRSPTWLAERFRTSPNAVAALAYRAREGLRQAYLSMNITVEDRPECKQFARKIPAQVRGTLPARENGPLLDHLGECEYCRTRRDELYVLVSDLPTVLWPALLLPIATPSLAGPGIAAGAAAGAGAGTAGGGALGWLSPSNWGQNVGRTVAVSGTVVAAAALAAAMMLVSYTPDDPPAAAPPPPPAEQQAPDPVVAPDPPADEPDPPENEPAPEDDPRDVPMAAPPADPEPPGTDEAPGFSAHPQSTIVRAGEPATLSATVTGSPAPGLQWQRLEASGWADMPGEDGPDLHLTDPTPDSDGSEYRVVATNDLGSAHSDPAELTVHYQPVVVAEPEDVDAGLGEDVVLRATADANPAIDTVRWQVRSGDGWTDLSGAAKTGATTTLALDDVGLGDGTTYRAVFTNEIGTAATEPATVTVDAAGALQAEVSWWGGPNETVVRCVEPTGDRVRLSECGASAWQLSADGELRWTDGTCLDVRDAGGPWRHATTASCTGSASQHWTIDPADSTEQTLENSDGVCLAAIGWGQQSLLAAHPCQSPFSQRFEFVPDG